MRQTDYALRVLIFLGERPERHCTISEMSRAHEISHNHLAKVVHELVKAGLLASIRGRMGGVRLALTPSEISIGSVVRSMECGHDIIDCSSCPIVRRCGLKPVLDRAFGAFLSSLDNSSLADVLAVPPPRERYL